MLEQELPDYTEEEQARENELELAKAKKPKVHTPLPFERGGDKESPKSSAETLPADYSSDNEVVVDLRSARLEAEKAFNAAEAIEPEEESSPEDDHKFIDSVWHRIEVDAAGHTVEGQEYGEAFHQEQRPENPVELDYADADAGASAGDENEVAVASGQLAVSTLEEDKPSAPRRPSGPAFSGSLITAAIERFEEMIQNLSQGVGSFTAFDVMLWAILFLIIIAIIFAIRA